ncbi:ubiquinone biosynthesis accessory factor UbiJ [Propionivibrio sp.]|uniref:ubiquinone biosynthesis accessory factor UbiJ n=1 Tax=Propionivibrio sp. TaxID=2212460 RepID=UPI003BF19A8D
MLINAALGLLNHLLEGEEWALKRLKVSAGQTARLELSALSLALEITSDGLFILCDKNVPATVTITLPADTPMRALTDRLSIFTAARISGSAELAENLGFVFRNLRWDVENDLSQLMGDIAARRLVAGGKQIAIWHQQLARNLALNLAEYFTEESQAIARHQEVSNFCKDIGSLQEEMARLEKRVWSLES